MRRNLVTLSGRMSGTNNSAGIRAAVKQNELHLEIYGDIGASFWGDGVTVGQVTEQLQAAQLAGVTSVKVHINSPGGSAWEGVAIYNVLRAFPASVTVIVDGLAASAASIIAMAGEKVLMGAGTMMMIHPAMMMLAGDSSDFREMAAVLEKVTGQMAEIYSAKTQKTKDELLSMMYAETWMSAQEACDSGFADGLAEQDGNAQAVASAFDLSIFAKVPEPLKTFKASAEPGEDNGRARLLVRRRQLALLTGEEVAP